MTSEFICLRFRLIVTSYSVRCPPSQGLAKVREPPWANQPPVSFTVHQWIAAESRRRLQRHAAGLRRKRELSLGHLIDLSTAKCSLGRSRQSLGWARSDAACGANEAHWKITILRRTRAFSSWCGSAGTRFSHAARWGGCTQIISTSITE
jgi:hypothetical protein